MVNFNIVPSKTAFLVIDLQNIFVEGYEPISAPDGLRCLKLNNELAMVCRQHGILVVHAAHLIRDDGSNAGVLGEILPTLKQHGLINETSVSGALHPKVEVKPGDVFLKKPRFGAFSGTDLDMILRGKGIDTVIIGGIATNICCETTAREANHHDYKVIFLSDGTTTAGYADQGWGYYSPEEVKKATLTTIAYIFGEVATVGDVINRIVHSTK
jgi:nicotinamidase-related amidase